MSWKHTIKNSKIRFFRLSSDVYIRIYKKKVCENSSFFAQVNSNFFRILGVKKKEKIVVLYKQESHIQRKYANWKMLKRIFDQKRNIWFWWWIK